MENCDTFAQTLGEPVARLRHWPADGSGWSSRTRRGGWLNGAAACALLFALASCGSAETGPGVTCDEYAQKELAPPNVGRESQSTDIVNLLTDRELPVSIDLTNKVQSAVNKFCGMPSPRGDSSAKRNNSRPISDAVDWDALKG